MSSRQFLHQQRFPERHQARHWIYEAVQRGVIPAARELQCSDCPNQAQQYDHYLGYAPEHRKDVQPVCIKCHAKRFRNTRIDHREPLPRTVRHCKKCEVTLPEFALKQRRYCSNCKNPHPKYTCKLCNSILPKNPGSGTRYCSLVCKSRARVLSWKKWYRKIHPIVQRVHHPAKDPCSA